MNAFKVSGEWATVMSDSRVGDRVTVEYADRAQETQLVSDLVAGRAVRTVPSQPQYGSR